MFVLETGQKICGIWGFKAHLISLIFRSLYIFWHWIQDKTMAEPLQNINIISNEKQHIGKLKKKITLSL